MNRRDWLIKSSLAAVSLGIFPLTGFALPSNGAGETTEKADGPINLSSNENPYGPSPLARKAMAESIGISNRYQWAMISKLMTAIAQKNNAVKDNIMVGAGSTELLDIMVQLAALKKGSMVVADPTFSRWTTIGEHYGMQKIEVPLTTDKKHDLPAMLKAIRPDTSIVYICNPNNPTGTVCDHDALVAFVAEASKRTLVVIDEAYIEFTTEKSLSDVAIKNKNLIVIRTFSKIYGLAGSRAGYAIAHTDTIDRMGQLRCGANIGLSAVTLAGAIASLNDNEFVNSTRSLNQEARRYTIEQMEQLNISCIPSHTNFIYFSLARYKKDFFALIKDSNIMGTEIFEENGKWSRITVGTMDEMKQLIAAIK